MSSKIEVQRICQHCGNKFTARTTVTRFCSHRCASAAYKQKVRTDKVEQSKTAARKIKTLPIEELKAKEFLTVREVARLLNCSVRSAYYYIENGTIKAVNLGQRVTRVKRSDIDKLFEQAQPAMPQSPPEEKQYDISECYSLSEVQKKYLISEKALYELVMRNNIPKLRKGWYAYVPKVIIDSLLS